MILILVAISWRYCILVGRIELLNMKMIHKHVFSVPHRKMFNLLKSIATFNSKIREVWSLSSLKSISSRFHLIVQIHALLLTTLLPETQLGGWVWRLELRRSRWNCCLLHCYHPRSGLLESHNRYTSSITHRSVGRYALLQCIIQVSHPGFLAFLIAVVTGHDDAEY